MDENRQIKRQLENMRVEALRYAETLGCHGLHHSFGERHQIGETCKALESIRLRLESSA